ncbi:unnamed protein product [Dracunculus medinensis]|uniref:SANT domain-containing protein n=1 Tax=Dracunculus medinensis TaxID=318479 RepID=A0A0N4UF42_DRAME|nr:unnamed protein product [Dracunculus medinensis]
MKQISLCCFLVILLNVNGWVNDEKLRIYDLIDEINANFYEFFNLSRIAAVYEILRSTDRRAIYDQILGEGLPDWRRPVYYYRFNVVNVVVNGHQDRIVIKRAQVPTFVPFHEYEVASDVKAFKAVNDIFSFGPNPETSGTGGEKKYEWSLEEMKTLIKLCNTKYRIGTPNRALQIQNGLMKVFRDMNLNDEMTNAFNLTMLKTSKKSGKNCIDAEKFDNGLSNSGIWTQIDQRNLEIALVRFPKGTEDRWDKIVEYVPNKTKQQCIDRFKELNELIRQRRFKK